MRGTTSHFNVSTAFDAGLWSVMAGSIAAVWVATLVISVMLFADPGPDRGPNDLRIPHFVGMHGLQLLPLLLIILEALSRRFLVLGGGAVRARLMCVATVGYSAIVTLVTWQALRGQSIVHPDALSLLALAGIVGVVSTTAAMALRHRPSRVGLARLARQHDAVDGN